MSGGAAGTSDPRLDFDAFLSYSNDPDYRIVRDLESFLESFHRLPTAGAASLPQLRICRDGSDFTLLRDEARGPEVPEVLTHHLARCRSLLLICSRGAARSPWVDRELQWWLEEARRSPSGILVAITEGEDPEARPEEIFSPRMMAAGLHRRPWYDLRQTRGRPWEGWKKVRLLEDERVRLAADLSGRAAGEILPLWYRQQRRTLVRQRTVAGAAAVVFLTISLFAVLQTLKAVRNERISLARQLAAQAAASLEQRPRLGVLLALESLAIQKELELAGETWGEGPLRDALSRATGLEASRGEEWKGKSTFTVDAAASPNNRWLAVPEPRGIREYDLSSPSFPSRFLEVPPEPQSEPPGGLEVADDGTMALWFTQEVEVSRPGQPAVYLPITFNLRNLQGTLLPDGGRLLTTDENGHLQLTNLRPPALRQDLGEAKDRAVLAVSPQGRDVATGTDDGRLTLFRLGTGEKIDLTADVGAGDPFDRLTFDADGTWLAASRTDDLFLWNLSPSPRKIAKLPGTTDDYAVLALGRGGKFVAQSEKGVVLLWRAPYREPPVHLAGDTKRVGLLRFSADGHWLAGVDRGTSILLWDLADLLAEPLVLRGKDEEIECLTFTPDGRRLVATGTGSLLAWNLDTLRSDPSVLHVEDGGSRVALFLDDTHLLVNSFKKEQLFTLPEGGPRQVRITPRDRSIKSFDGLWWGEGTPPKGITLRNTERPAMKPLQWPVPFQEMGLTVAVSEDGALLASNEKIGRQEQIQLWRPGGKRPFQVIATNGRAIDLAIDPRGGALAARDMWGEIRFWKIPGPGKGMSLARFPRRSGSSSFWTSLRTSNENRVLAFSPSGTYLAAFNETEIRLWRVENLAARPLILRGFQDDLAALAFDRAETRLAAGGKSGQIYLWALPGNAKAPLVLRGHREPITSLDFSPSGRWLASADMANLVRRWRMRTDELVAEGCRLANRNLTQEEWDLYIGKTLPYHVLCPAGQGG